MYCVPSASVFLFIYKGTIPCLSHGRVRELKQINERLTSPADCISLFANPQCSQRKDITITSRKKGMDVRRRRVVPYRQVSRTPSCPFFSKYKEGFFFKKTDLFTAPHT